MRLPLLVLVGPTATGKSAVAVEVARRLGGEIISGDSMQVYRAMDIGTAKITAAQMQGVPHHMIDIREPDQPFSVAEFQGLVDRLIHEICSRGNLPLLVGGTGLYVRSVIEAYTFTEQAGDQQLRAQLAAEAEQHGSAHLHQRLAQVDAEAARRLHPNDLRRIIRALEVYLTTGDPITATQTVAQSGGRYDDLMIGLSMDRESLYRRIDQRVEQMLDAGWSDEVRRLLARYPNGVQAMQSLGYREMVFYWRGLLTWTEAISLIKRNTRRFAKRQLTWFRRERRLTWLEIDQESGIRPVVEMIVRMAEGKWPRLVEREATDREKA